MLIRSFRVKDLFSLSSDNGIDLVILSHLQTHPFLLPGVVWLVLKMRPHQDALCQLMEAVRSNTADAAVAKQRKAVAVLLFEG